ncbi:phosphatidate cytidylyltransferase [Ophiocordyceps camponoti-floridani]|uniref:dolichol kinase n=1 Tax=Ophiocordyceps camponoti-floridani TaxID=2030778 RepID=A0A8H4VBB3_9HYPO|nr:phosphatidate cytidylyltransferase [Ophiocordyceps camponoti-floridani]
MPAPSADEASKPDDVSPTLSPDDPRPYRALSRSPHPYHHQTAERCVLDHHHSSSPPSESGTDADDEHFLKGLPASRVRLHKGLRGQNEFASRPSTPLVYPASSEHEMPYPLVKQGVVEAPVSLACHFKEAVFCKKVLIRRVTELCLVALLGRIVRSNAGVSLLLAVWRRDLQLLGLLMAALLALYPLRVAAWAYRRHRPCRPWPFEMPLDFDPAPLLYPPAITVFASLLISVGNQAVLLPNIVLSISALPRSLIPAIEPTAPFDTPHWLVSSLPLIWTSSGTATLSAQQGLTGETLVLLHPLHQTLCSVLQHLTTTSLLEAELQLLSVALINILVLAVSPQMQVLKALLWVGGLSAMVLCGPVISWGISLARVPKWRFRKDPDGGKDVLRVLSWRRASRGLLSLFRGDGFDDGDPSSEDDKSPSRFVGLSRVRTLDKNGARSMLADSKPGGIARRHTMPHPDKTKMALTSSGRRRRATSGAARPFLRLTQAQATRRKWMYAAYVYACLLAIILVGVRAHVQRYALGGHEPIGWGLGYLLGDWPWFRDQAGVGRWTCLDDDGSAADGEGQHLDGWVQRLRSEVWGEAKTRLMISGYWLAILIVGLMVVLRLKDTYEVDTRRKVFHFMMVGMFLPATYVDPAFAALALALMLALFLMLDLVRASQLPPLSKPIASFLAPYVDGRDFRGSVVVSHIFLLIGCAIPLWLALATVPRTTTAPTCRAGWEVTTREVSMVSGVVCVGLGDAAASLIGRRFGHRKWLWGGGKSLEGSAAFALAVSMGLAAASAWLRAGGWSVADGEVGGSLAGALVCASVASLTEAVLTGGNDNVIVPVVLWTCVKSLGV